MTKESKPDRLRQMGALNPRPEGVRAPWFREAGFFDPLDLVQVKYLFAGIKMSSFITRYRCQKLLTQEVIFSAENRPVFDWNGGRLQIGMVAGL
jgi:hypothetical protein